MSQKPSPGRIVHYVLEHGSDIKGQVRPAMIVAVCNERFGVTSYQKDECQIEVFLDGANDLRELYGDPAQWPPCPNWRTSVPYDESGAPGSWHWPPKV